MNFDSAPPAASRHPLVPRFAHALRGTAPAMEGPPRDAAELGARYARRDAERRAGKAKVG